jgi:hypothetical protein
MTKYVINSGGIGNNPTRAKEYFAEILKGFGDKPKLLICCFANPREDWEEKLIKDKEGIINLAPEGVSPILELAFPKKFEEQIKNCDAMYIHGGDDHLLKYWFEKFDIPKIWEGKVIATNSASSNILAKYFWTCDWRETIEGMGILPIKFIPHYNSNYGNEDSRGPIDWAKAYKELENYKDKTLPIHALEEGDFIVINK